VEAEGLEAELLNVDLVEVEEKFWNIAEVLPAVTNSGAPFMFVMQASAVLSQSAETGVTRALFSCRQRNRAPSAVLWPHVP
jgi:hypothetical protein